MLKDGLELLAGEVIDGTFMSKAALVSFLEEQVADAKQQGVLFSLHMKATMMKVSDPIIFGHAREARTSRTVFEKHAATFEKLGVDVNNGFGDLESRRSKTYAADAERERDRGGHRGGVRGTVPDHRAWWIRIEGITNLHGAE